MDITINFEKSVEQNAEVYYDRAKKAKKKMEGAKKALERSRLKLADLEKKKTVILKKKEVKKKERKKEWFERFRWFVSSEGFLVIGGRDASTNEIIIKKYTEPDDLVFHTEAPGSPFFVIKTQGKKPGEATINETAQATLTFSRAWRNDLTIGEVYHIAPEQVSKEAKSGEYLAKGAFMIYGKRNYHNPEVKMVIGMDDKGRIMAGPPAAVKKHCKKAVEVIQGREKPGKIAKQIQHFIGGELDDIIRALPGGGVEVKK